MSSSTFILPFSRCCPAPPGWWPATEPAVRTPESPARVLQHLRDGDSADALQAFGALADKATSMQDVVYSALPAAAGGMHRAMAQMSSDEQVEWLENWTLPDSTRKGVRLLSVPVPTETPPKVFDGPKFESNFHPVWFDGPQADTSPWLGLRSSGSKRPLFRNPRLSGKPVIPSEVKLTGESELRGWQSGFFRETQPPFERVQASNGTDDWRIESGVLIGAKQSDSQAAARPGLLQYQRPLLDGESIRYEFFLGGEGTIVHPAMGRLAFLLETGGMRIRWITTGESEWTGLSEDNMAMEPLNRRGPRTLPLQTGDWNAVQVDLVDGELLVQLNGELIYQRLMETDRGAQFGLYRPKRTSQARIRNPVMKGNWPDTVPDGFLEDPFRIKTDTPLASTK